LRTTARPAPRLTERPVSRAPEGGVAEPGDYSFDLFNPDDPQLTPVAVAERAKRSTLRLEHLQRRVPPLPGALRLKATP
jgi:hypothetical protein